MLLTKSTAFIIGPIATVLGYIMNAIFWLQVKIGIPNIGLAIIIFTFVIYMLLMPLTVQQQKFSKLQAKMNPELQAINKKYKNAKNDQNEMARMNEETRAVYAKYGVHPMGSCLQLIIQLPILFALYRVIWNMPAYVTSIYNAFQPLAEKIAGLGTQMQEYMETAASSLSVSKFTWPEINSLIDTLYKFKPANWSDFAASFPDISSLITSTQAQIDKMNFFLGLNIADSPMTIIRSAWTTKSMLLIIGAALVPILSAVTQWLNAKLTTVGTENKEKTYNPDDNMSNTMRSMNTIMPLMSAFFCLTLPVGMGIYWIAGAVIRSIQQVVVNKHLEKMDIDELIKNNLEKANAKRQKQGLPPQKVTNTAKMSTKNIASPQKKSTGKALTAEERADKMKASTEYYKNTTKAKPGSLAAKAQMVQQYNERNKKK